MTLTDADREWLDLDHELIQMTELNFATSTLLIKIIKRRHPGKEMRDLTVRQLTECREEAAQTLYPEMFA